MSGERSSASMLMDHIPRARARGMPFRFMIGGARRRRSGGDPGEGCARRPVGTYLDLHAVGAGNHVAVPCMAQ
jgi:hypothetical protein